MSESGDEKARVLTKAVINTAEYLDLPEDKLALILDVSTSTVSQLYAGI